MSPLRPNHSSGPKASTLFKDIGRRSMQQRLRRPVTVKSRIDLDGTVALHLIIYLEVDQCIAETVPELHQIEQKCSLLVPKMLARSVATVLTIFRRAYIWASSWITQQISSISSLLAWFQSTTVSWCPRVVYSLTRAANKDGVLPSNSLDGLSYSFTLPVERRQKFAGLRSDHRKLDEHEHKTLKLLVEYPFASELGCGNWVHTGIQHEHLVATHDRGNAMCNTNDCGICESLLHRLLNQPISVRIYRCCSFVQYQDFGSLEECSSQTEQLLLPHTPIVSIVGHRWVKLFGFCTYNVF